MFDLKCKRQDCVYNKNCNCDAKNVDVARSTECKTYEPSKTKKKQKDEIKQTPTRKNTAVDCEAKCIFNDKCICKANGITVMTNDQKPECASFMPR